MRPEATSSGNERPLERGAWAVAAVAAVLAIVASCVVIPMFFPTNDDAYVVQVLSGGGGVAAEPLPLVPFINYALCLPFSLLYTVAPSIPWWVIFHFAAIGASLVVMGRALVVVARRRARLPLAAEAAALTLLDFGLCAYLVGRLQFTSTALLLMAAAVVSACLQLDSEGENKGGAGPRVVLPVCLASVGFALRTQSGYLGLFFWALAILAIAARGEGGLGVRLRGVRRPLAGLVLSGVIAVALFVVNAVAYLPESLTRGNELGSAMSGYTDYPRTPYSQDPERYEAVGWDEELARLVGDYWFMMDERVNTEALESINEQNTAPLDELVAHPKETVLNRLHYVAQPVPMTYLALLLGVGVAALALSPSRGERLVTWIIVGAVVVLLGYLLLRGRLLERAAYAVTLPATAALATVVARGIGATEREGRSLLSPALATVLGALAFALLWQRAPIMGKLAALLGLLFCVTVVVRQALMLRGVPDRRTIKAITAGTLLLACALALAPGVVTVKKYGVGSWDAKEQARLLDNTNALFDYVSEHPDKLYIYSGCPITLQYVWQGEWPKNHTGWGGWRYPYDWFDEAMRDAGFDGRPTSEDFLEGDTLFVSANEGTCDLLLRYMRNTFGEDVQMVPVDHLQDGMVVYQFEHQM